MENKEQLLANFLTFKDIPFGDYKNIITTPKAMEFYAKNTPIDQLQSMFVSAGFESPETINKASNVLKEVYNELQSVDELSYSGEYKTGRERQELKRIMQELKGGNEEEDEEEQLGNDENIGGFFDESGRGGYDIEKALKAFNELLENGSGNDIETTFDELLGRGNGQGKDEIEEDDESQGDDEGQEEEDENQGDADAQEDNDGNKKGDGDGQENKEENRDNEAQDESESQGESKSEGQGQGDENSDGDEKAEGESQGQGEGKNKEEKESDQNKDNQQKQKNKQKEKQKQQNASLEREIKLCSEEIAQFENEKELLDFLTNKTQEQEFRIKEIDLNIDDLKIQISNMLSAINADVVLGNDVEFPVNRLPRYISSKIPEFEKRIKEESEKRVEDPNYFFKYKIDDKKRRNALILERVKEDISYFAFEKLKKENALSELYLTKNDIPRIVFEMGSDEIPKKIVLESTIEGDTAVIDEAINIDTFIYQMNNLEKDLELVNKENNIKLIFDTIKNELFNKFMI